MKKIVYLISIIAVTVFFSSAASAHDRYWGWHDHGWRHPHHGYHHGWGGYPRREVNNYYYSQPQGNNYYQQPPAYFGFQQQFYPPQPRYNYNGRYCDRR